MMTKLLFPILILISFSGNSCREFNSKEERLEWWKDARFGMFIHWGPVSIKGTEIGWSRGREIPIDEYDLLYKQFNPVDFDALEWVRTAKAAGMKYIVFTSKHHDGFCMWDTKFTEFNIMNSPFKRDVMKELSEACRKEGVALGFYHSTCDWHHPGFPLTSPGGSIRRETSDIDRYTEYLKNQSSEIIKNYGPLLVMWYDVPREFDRTRGQGVIDHIRKIQPDILVNNRLTYDGQKDHLGGIGDFDTPEQRIGSFQNERPWETCMTIGRQWAWKPNDEIKSLEQCLQSLIRSAGGDGNLLFNVGPRPDGTIEPLQVMRLKEMGEWLSKYGHTIYGTRGGPLKPSDWGVSTRKGNKIFLHILKWDGGTVKISLPDLGMGIKKCILADGGEVSLNKNDRGYEISFDGSLLKPVNTIVEIEVDGKAMDIIPQDAVPQSLSYMKKVTASTNPNPAWNDISSVNNGDWVGTFWQPAKDDKEPWAEVDLGLPMVVSKAVLFESGQNIKSFELEYKSEDNWITFYTGTAIGAKTEIQFPEIISRYIRLVITGYSGPPGIYEFLLLSE